MVPFSVLEVVLWSEKCQNLKKWTQIEENSQIHLSIMSSVADIRIQPLYLPPNVMAPYSTSFVGESLDDKYIKYVQII